VIRGCFADAGYRIGLSNKQDALHAVARAWTNQISGTNVTTAAVLLETANALSRPVWRAAVVELIESLRARTDVAIVPWSDGLIARAWGLYAARRDKEWALTDCGSFVVMSEYRLTDARADDPHFEQAGFRALLRLDPKRA